MDQALHENKTFDKIIYADQTIKGKEFHDCTFNHCDFTDSDFSNNKFMDCTFNSCNLSMMKLRGTSLNHIEFKNCKILGVNFSECHDFLFTVDFESCILDYASFAGKKMLKTAFVKTSLKEVSFTQSNLGGSLFQQTDLLGSVFSNCDLTGVNFSTAFNFSIDPELNIMKNASFSLEGLAGLLNKHKIKIV
ncbi:pentapeptide repeat-containing protein [Pedobacter sp.]|uniref:pentapeptide repeat-containing protein n=1 Tax=Pedobacter sp. TaxID=1411316 RepID=UPI003D7F8367